MHVWLVLGNVHDWNTNAALAVGVGHAHTASALYSNQKKQSTTVVHCIPKSSPGPLHALLQIIWQ
jgi:hypothetical protein